MSLRSPYSPSPKEGYGAWQSQTTSELQLYQTTRIHSIRLIKVNLHRVQRQAISNNKPLRCIEELHRKAGSLLDTEFTIQESRVISQ